MQISRNYRIEEYPKNSKTDTSRNDVKSALGKISLFIKIHIFLKLSD